MGKSKHKPPARKISAEQRRLVNAAVNSGIDHYIAARKARVPAFVKRHFSFKGALQLHRKALGPDLYKAPLNIFWLLPATLSKTAVYLLEKAGAKKIAQILKRMPSGWQTDVQKEINWLIYTELLELPYRQDDRVSTKDALLEEILRDPELNALLAGSIITLSTGYAALHKAVPGALAGGSAVAAVIAEKIAIAQFWLGPTLGAWYYSLFPAAASTGLVVAATASLMAGLALLSTFTGIVTDPLQARLGLHQKRLHKFLDALHAELAGTKPSQYHIKEQYIARVFDIIDLLSTALRS